MSEPEAQSGGELFDAPNKQAVGLDPPWVEGSGGSSDEPAPRARPESVGNLDEMTKEELLEYAQSLGVKPANAAMTKDEIRAGIDQHQGG